MIDMMWFRRSIALATLLLLMTAVPGFAAQPPAPQTGAEQTQAQAGVSLHGWLVRSTHGVTEARRQPYEVRGPVTTAVDVYAAGVLLYVLLSGCHPTAEGCRSPAEVLAALQERHPAPLGLADLDRILTKALRKEWQDRYRTTTALGDDLSRWLNHEPVTARAPRW